MFSNFNELKKKKLYTIVAVILLTAMYVIIFLFSAKSGEESSGLSGRIADWLMEIYDKLFGKGAVSGTAAETELFPVEALIRKLAHLTEYMCVGALSYSIVLMWYTSKWKGRLLVLLQVFASGALDEFHQYFVPGRAAMFRDVLIDTAGGAVGIIVVWLWHRIAYRRKRKLNT